MSDTEQAAATEAEPQQNEPKPTETVDFWKTKARENEKRAKANADAAQRLAQLEESQKTNEQRLTERAETAERRIPELEGENRRLRVAIAKGLPADLIDRLRGDSEEEIAADADALLALVAPPQTTTAPGPRPDLSQGRSSDMALNGDPLTQSLKDKLGIP